MEASALSFSATSALAQLLATGLFNAFDAASLRDLEAELTWVKLNADDVLFHQDIVTVTGG